MYNLLQGDCRQMLQTLPDESVQTVVTSPPYWGLRDYGIAEQLGLEPTPEEYVAHMVEVFREVRRVLRSDGTLWLNVGDSYAGGGGFSPNSPSNLAGSKQTTQRGAKPGGLPLVSGLKAKDLVGIPWRLALALQVDGWYLRADIVWSKPNPMPESVRDRPTRSHEYLFLLAKSEKYYYDNDAIREPCTSGPADVRKMIAGKDRIGGKHKELDDPLSAANRHSRIGRKRSVGNPEGRNRRSVWTVATIPFKGAHFATFPPKLIEPCILAGSRPGDFVLDPFSGAGTTGLVAMQHEREYIGIEINPAYNELAEQRYAKLRQQTALW